MYILGINCAYHESAACLTAGGRLLAAAEEERFNRTKHGKRALVDNAGQLPLQALSYCLEEAGLGAADGIDLSPVDHIGFSLLPHKRYQANVGHRHPYPIRDGDYGSEAGEACFRDRCLAVEGALRDLGFRGRLHFLDHHACHAASSFFLSPFDQAAVLVVDGIGEFNSTTLFHAGGRHLRPVHSVAYPHSLGFLWEKLAVYLGFDEYDAAKVMGLASFGDPAAFAQAWERLVTPGADFRIDDRLTRFRSPDCSPLEALFGLPRGREPIQEVTAENQPYADVAAGLQQVTEEIVLALAEKAAELHPRHLCMSGGVALNCVANGRLLRQGPFAEVFIEPACHDAGTAVGAAYLIHHSILEGERCEPVESPYLGPRFSKEQCREALDAQGLLYEESDDAPRRAAELVAAGNVVAWFQGRMEIGPRALGNRSILADPRRAETVEQLNRATKHREAFRPFCPSVLEEEIPRWFEGDGRIHPPARYMLSTYEARLAKRRSIPAVVHVDSTARLQAVGKALNPRYHRLITAFFELTGVPMVLNTSFNDREPIVCTPEDALKTFLATDIDVIVIDDFIVVKSRNALATTAPDVPLETYFEKLR